MIEIDITSATPVYRQIVGEIKAGRLTGRWRAGDRIPPVRELAAALRINPNTVAKAYRQLQVDGVIAGRQGGGNFVVPMTAESLRRERLAQLDSELRGLLNRTDRLGISRAEVLAALRARIAENEKEAQ